MVAAYDNNCIANKVYQRNFKMLPQVANIEHLNANHFEQLDADFWLMSPPCQPFTRGGKRLDDQDKRSSALLHMIEVLKVISEPPKYLLLENVLNFENSNCCELLLAALSQRGYVVHESLLSPMDDYVGIPNDRLRYYLTVQNFVMMLTFEIFLNFVIRPLGSAMSLFRG